MSDRKNTDERASERPRFDKLDEQERLYAPEEVPDANLPAEEVDKGGTAASGPAVASTEGDQGESPVSPVPPPASGFSFPASGVPPGPGPDDSDLHPLGEDDTPSSDRG